MKTPLTISTIRAFSRLDLLIAMALGIVLAMIFLPAMSDSRRKAQRIDCVNNLKQVGLAFRLWETDHGTNGLFPQNISTNLGGTAEFTTSQSAYRHFQILSNELQSVKILLCQSDAREPAESFKTMASSNLGYFVGLDASELAPRMILSGDRNLLINDTPANGLVALATNSAVGWSWKMHRNAGNIAFADGSAQLLASTALAELIQDSGGPNRLLMP